MANIPMVSPPPPPRQVGWVVSSMVGTTICANSYSRMVHDEYRHETQAPEIAMLEKFCLDKTQILAGT